MTKCGSSPDDLNVWKKETAVINGVKVEFDFKDLGPPDPALLEMGSAKKRLGNKAKVKYEHIPIPEDTHWDGGHRFATRPKKGIKKYHREYGIKHLTEAGNNKPNLLNRNRTSGIVPSDLKRRRRLLQNNNSGS
jgi:hypothetical protein